MAKYPTPSLEKQNDRGGVYYFRFRQRIGTDANGKPIYKRYNISTEFKTIAEAKPYAEDYIRDFIDGTKVETRILQPVAPVAAPKVLLKDRINKFIEMKYIGKMAKNTIVGVQGNLKRMVNFLAVEGRDEVTPSLAAEAYHKFQRAKNKQNRLPNAKGCDHWIKDVCRYWDWEVALKQVSENPFRGDHIDRPSSDEFTVCDEIWDPSESRGIYEELELPEDKAAFWVMRWSAMYPADVFHLRKPHVVVKPGLGIFKRREKSTSKKQIIKLPISEACKEIEADLSARVSAIKDSTTRIYARHYPDHKQELWREILNKRVKAAWRRRFPGTKPKNIKSLRHTRTTEWLEAGIEPDVIGTWLGHVDGSRMVLAIYAHRKALKMFKKAS